MKTGFATAVGCLILAVLVSIVVPEASYVAAVCGLVALVLGLPRVRRGQRMIGFALIGTGLLAGALAVLLGHEIEPLSLLNLNQDLVGMLGAVAFLGFIARTVGEVRPRLRGVPAVLRTMFVTHLLGSVINMSAATVVADHLRRGRTLHPADSVIVVRGFATGGFWSPFWAGAALALVFAPTANIGLVVLVGAPLAAIVLVVTVPTILRLLGDELPEYRGYAISWHLLRIPLVLMVAVLVLHVLLPEVTMPRLVALSAIAVLLVYTVVAGRRQAPRILYQELRTVLPALGGEVVLFVSAGIMALGLTALLSTLRFELPFDSYSVWLAWASIAVIVLFALIGVHQVISIGIIGSLVLPMNPDPTLFMLSAIIGHGVSAAVGPLTGLQMYMQGRYGVNGLDTTRRNIPYMIATLVLAVPALLLAQWLSGIVTG